MVSTIHTDNEDELRVVARPVHKTKSTAALLQHSEKVALPSQTKAINDFCAAEAAKLATEHIAADQTEISPAPKNSKRVWSERIFDTDIENSDDEHENACTNPKCEFLHICKCIHFNLKTEKQVRQATVMEDGDDKRENARTNPKCEFLCICQCIQFVHLKTAKRVCQAAVLDQEDVDEDGILADIDVQPITDPGPSREDKTCDLDRFFSKPFERTGANGIVKKHRKCTVCPYVVSPLCCLYNKH
jgi:hypothetical protein